MQHHGLIILQCLNWNTRLKHNNLLFVSVDCAADEFTCHDGLTCIPEDFRCDYYPDCPDNSDEIDGCICDPIIHFECVSGGCVNATWRCDGIQDCFDVSDEMNCTECAEGVYLCANGNCIPEEFRCDYINDCEDNIDEVDGCVCDPSIEFICTCGGCINATWICDGEEDCDDGSDEAADLCVYTTENTMTQDMFTELSTAGETGTTDSATESGSETSTTFAVKPGIYEL